MPQVSTSVSKTFTLRPSWKQFFVPYLLSILAIPILGIGLITLYFVWKKHKNIYYKVTDTRISSVDPEYHQTIDLVNINRIELQQSWLQQKLSIGTLVLYTPGTEMLLIGMTTPQQLQHILEQAVEAEILRQNQRNKTKPRQPAYEPGSLDKMDYLTGLWQQGLISNEDFEKERKHFE